MKWSADLDNELVKLINEGKKHSEISLILGLTVKSVSNRCFRLGLKIIHTKEYLCDFCGEVFIDYINNERKFCSKSCSNSNSAKNREHSDKTKEKIKNSLLGRKKSEEIKNKIKGDKNGMWIDGRSIKTKGKIKKNKINLKELKRKCKYCEQFKVNKKRKMICDECRFNYYEVYRPSCEFDFDCNKFLDYFDFSLVEEYGWYSPTNKGNNLNGVSKDHLFSIRDGFKNKVDPNIMKHPANCKLMLHKDNASKSYNSEITLDQLLERISNWGSS